MVHVMEKRSATAMRSFSMDSAKGTVKWRFAHLEEREKMTDKNESAQAQNKGEMPNREVVRLLGLVNYQEGSVVSRTIVKRATGTLSLFVSMRAKV